MKTKWKDIKKFAIDHEEEFEVFAGELWSKYKQKHNLDLTWLDANFNDFMDYAAAGFYSIYKTIEK